MIGRRTKILLLLLLIAVGTIDSGRVFAQTAPTGCPSIMAAGSVSGRDTVLPHGGCITLRAEVVATATTANDYTVSQIQYNPPFSFQAGTQINLTSDDYYAAVINLPFPFCFYGNTYTQACVGANGIVSFNVSNNGGYCAYNYSSYVPIPNANFPSSLLNAIYGVCEDIWPGHSTGGGRIFQGVLGTYPCRTACISYDQCPLFGNYTTHNSYQIVIYEGTNIIDVYIKNRNCCSSTNRGQGLVGLQNANGTRAVTAPNRNGGVWTTTNEAWRFTPVGTPNYTVSWYYGTDTSASGRLLKIDTIHSDTAMSRLRVCPIAADTFTARLKYVACNGDAFDMISSTVITNAGLTYFDTVLCASDCYSFNGKRYCSPGVYVDTLKDVYGYDSIISRIRISDTIRDTIHRTICAGASFDTNGQRYRFAGQYIQHLRQPDSCFNNLVIDLTVSDTLRDTIYRTICAGARFDTNGQRYYLAGQYIQHLRQPDSCFNNLVIALTVSDTIRDTIYRTICAGASFDTNGQRYYLAGQYIQHLRQPDSCYNNLVINLTVSDTIRDTIHRTICAGARFDTNGQRYYLAGQYIQHLRQPDSCFNNLVINLTVTDTIRDTIHRTICAGASFDTNGHRYRFAGQYIQHLRQPDSCYNNLVINLAVSDTIRDTIHRTICAGASFDTNGQRYYLAGQYIQHLRQPDSCYNNLVINLTVTDTIRDTIHRTICAGASFDTNGQRYYLAGQYIQHLRQPDSCYNNLVINLTVSDTIRDTIHRTICAGVSFDTNGQRYRFAGQYIQHLRQPDSCYNNLVINLTVSDTIRDTIHRTICAGVSFDTNGQRYRFAGQYIQHLRQPDSCYNNLVINLTVSDTIRDTIHRTICAGASFDTNGQRYRFAGQYIQHLRQPDSCYNNLVINLTITDTIRDTIHRTICAGASFDTNGQRYYLTGQYIQHLRQPDSCYNNLVINLTVSDTIRDTIHRTICAGASFDTNGQRYITQGFYSQLLRDTATGCYNRLYINLIVRDTFRTVVWQNICAGATFSYGGQSYYLQGTYLQQRYTVYGCDSITEIHLTVNDTIRDTVEHSVCAGQTVNVNGRTYYRDGWYRQHLRTSDGCDSILHIRLNVADTIRDTLYFSVCAGKTIEVNGITYANRGWHRQSLRTPDGCDSILHIALMVDDTIRSHNYDTICDGQLYHYHDSTYRAAGAYRHLLKTPDGCDSIVTMHLFVRDTSVTHLYDTIELGDSTLFFGQYYSQQGIYTQALTRSDNGCDSTVVLHLKVCHTIFTYLYDTICTNHSFRFGDTVIARQGVYSRVEYTEDLCDSVIVLNLAVIDYPTLSLVDSGSYCEGGVATLAAVTNANHITWSSFPTDSTLFGQENEFVIHVSPDRYVEYIATVDIQPYNCETSDVISLNKPATLIADIAINPAEITNDNLAVTFADNSIGEVVSRRWLFHEDDPTTRDRQVLNDSIVHYTASPISDSLEVTLIVASGYGCHDTARNIYPIRKGDIWVPNAFTPGRRNAGQNSLFKVKYNNVLEYEINIYTREGLLVFHSTNPDISWDGTYNYKDCKGGSYVYVVRYTTKKYPKLLLEQKGMVLLIR